MPTSKKQQKTNLAELNRARDAAHEKNWLRGNRTSMEQNHLDAGRQTAKKK